MPKANEKLNNWKAEIRRGLNYQEVFGERKMWNTYYNYYHGNWKSDIYAVNKVFSILRSMIPRVYFRNPKILITGKRPEFEAKAVVNQAVANLLIRQMGIKQTLKKIIQDVFFCNRGMIKIGYSSQYGALSHLGKKALPANERLEYSTLVQQNFPWALRTNPENFVVPWGTSDLQTNTRWVAHRVVRLLDDVKKDTIYENTSDLKGGYVRKLRGKEEQQEGISDYIESGQAKTAAEYQGKNLEWVDIWEVRDLKRGEVLALNLNHNKFLRNPTEDTLQIDGAPFVDLCFNPDNDVYWGPSDVKIMAPLQEELNETRTQMSRHRKLNLIKFLYDSGKILPEEFNKLMDGEVGGGLGINELTRDSVVVFPIGEPVQLRQDAMDIERDLRDTVGFSRTDEGEYAGPPRRTKAEIQAVQSGHWIRVDERRDLVADFLIEVVKRVLQIVYKQWNQAQVIAVVGPDNAVHWVRYTGAELHGDYELEVDMDTGQPVTSETQRAEAEKLLALFTGRPDLVNERELAKGVLKLYPFIDVDRVLAPQQQGMGQPQVESMDQFAGGFGG